MEKQHILPIFSIQNFEDYNHCMAFEKNFYVRPFKNHLKVNKFIEKPHGHNFYLVLFITEGSGKHTIDFNEYKVGPGSVFVLAPGQVHYWELSEDTDGYILFFTREYFLIDFNHDRLSSLPFFNSSFSLPYLMLEEQDRIILNSIFDKINIEYNNSQLHFHEMIKLYLNIMFIELERISTNHNQIHQNYTYELIQLNKFEALIDLNFKEHKNIPFYADALNISLKQLSHVCKKTVAKTPIEMLIERIILEAKRLLIHSDLSICTIAETLNFSDNSYFVRSFKKHCDMTPEHFRQSFLDKKKNDNPRYLS